MRFIGVCTGQHFQTASAYITVLLIILGPFDSESAIGLSCVKSDVNTAGNKRISSVPKCVKGLEGFVKLGSSQKGNVPGYVSNKTLPAWFNPELARIGQKFAQKNSAGIYYSIFIYTIFLFTNTDIRRVLVDTKKSITPELAFRRMLTHLIHTELWFNDDIRVDYENLYQSLNSVRYRHQGVLHKSLEYSERMNKRLIPEPLNGENPAGLDLRIWNAFEKDLQSSRFSIFPKAKAHPDRVKGNRVKYNQFSLAVAHFMQFGIVMAPEKLLVYDATEEELMGYLHLWAFLGKAVGGIEDEYNLCLQPDVNTAKTYFRNFVEQDLVPTLFNLDYETKYMYEIAFMGLNNAFAKSENLKRINMPNTMDFFLLRLMEDILEIPSPHLKAAQTEREQLGTEGFKVFARPDNFKWTRDLTNRMVRRVFRIWTKQKFGINSKNGTAVSQYLYV